MLTGKAEARAWFVAELGCDAGALERLDLLETLLRDENDRQNLVAQRSLEDLWVRHFADSAQLLRYVPRETPPQAWLDLGSGAGFPGLIVAACRPELSVILIESRAKRIAWLSRAVAALGLEQTRVAGASLERIPSKPASVISARAFAPLSRLLALSARFSTPQTLWLLPKGRGGRKELAEMPKTIRAMFHVEQSLTDPESAILIGRGIPPLPGARP